jgi:FKBP-type peptidyl-prolyl cis-trans isomerase SlyD
VEAALEGQAVGHAVDIVLEPDDAFGEYDAELVKIEPLDVFPEEVKVGMQLEGASEDGEHVMLYTVTEVADGKVVVDGNHPLAGQSLRIQLVVHDVRAASAEEIEHGHVHGEHGHHH